MRRHIIYLIMIIFTAVSPAISAEEYDAVKVAYLGPEGTYTEEAALFWFTDDKVLLPKDEVSEAVEAVLTGEADFAVIPQENTLGGAVTNYIDTLILTEDIWVTGEVILPISQTLMGVPGATVGDIRIVCSHAQGLTQSGVWLAENIPDAETRVMQSTAAAANFVAEQNDKSIAAIAAPGAARLYGLEILATDVQISDTNKTRFYVLSNEQMSGEKLTHAVFIATCEANRIDDILIEIHEAGLEIVCLHDRPEGSDLGCYNYVIEVESESGITEDQVEAVEILDGVRLAGRFQTVQKK